MSDVFDCINSQCGATAGDCGCVSKLRSEIDHLRGHLQAIADWADAYPLEIFPEPDLKRAHKLLQAGGMTLDAISASAMRHVVSQISRIGRCGLEDKP